ncbi:MAG: hypothetical protein IKI99_00575 [Firmicutes bacterium]|nr:hypothetical protein [Bacillota bacterium]
MWFKDSLLAQLRYLEREKERICNQLRVLPKEKLIRKHAHGKDYYYFESRGRRVSLFGNAKAISEYLFRDNLQRQLEAINFNIPVLQRTIKGYRPLAEKNSNWTSIEAQQNTYHDEHRVHTWNGIRFASKSEMLIAMALTSYGIEFKYESKMYVNGRYIYPDFVIKRPKDDKIFIWEHFGKMQEDDYRRKNINRIEEFHQVGYYLWDNFIASFDLGKNSINMDYIDKIIKLYLL